MGVTVYGVKSRNPSDVALPRRDSRQDLEEIVSRRKDLAFVMYTDKDVAEVNKLHLLTTLSEGECVASPGSNFCFKKGY